MQDFDALADEKAGPANRRIHPREGQGVIERKDARPNIGQRVRLLRGDLHGVEAVRLPYPGPLPLMGSYARTDCGRWRITGSLGDGWERISSQ